jgi:hypothetical protein
MSSWNIDDFMRFFSKGLNPFKIQTKFKFELFPRYLIKNSEGFGDGPKRKVVS